jgi:N-acetylneuraminate synthase
MKTKIIGEIGINHNGDLNIAKKLIDLCSELNIEAVKFQKRDIYKVYSKDQLSSKRESPWGETQEDQKKGLEFGRDEYDEIDKYCKDKKIKWFASAWDIESLQFLDKYNSEYNKIASAMITSNKFLNEVAERQNYTFISTGMSDLKIIDNAVEIFEKKKCKYELMYCVSVYPCKPDLIDLNCIKTLKDKYNCNVGYSGHENGIAISLAAMGMGISSLERHITIDRTIYGSDQAASMEPNGFRTLVKSVQKIEKTFGKGEKKILNEENEIIKKLRSHINNI